MMTDDDGVAGCPLCERDDRKMIEEGLFNGSLTKTAVANTTGMSTEEVYQHTIKHMSVSKVNRHSRQVEEGLDSQYNKYDMLFNNLVDLNSLFGALVEQAHSSPNDAQVQRLTKMASEIRQTISDLARLKGEMVGESKITIIHYNQLKAVVMSSLCKECRQSVANELESENYQKKIEELMRR